MRRAAAAAADASGAWNTSCTASALCWPEFAEVAGPAEGFFRLARQRGRWWLITPRGRGYLAVGFNHAGPRYLQSPGNRDHWAQLLARPGALQAKVLEDARHWNLTCVGYGEVRPAGMFPWFQTVMAPCASCWMPDPSFPDVFHADFERDSLRAARQACAPWREDPALIGYLLNDVPEWPRPGHCSKRRTRDWIGVLKGGGRESPGKRRFVELLRDRHGGQIDSVNRIYGTRFHDLEQILDDVHLADRTAADPVRVGEDDAAFAALLVERWMEVVCGAVRQADGNHLLFGPRLDGNRGLPGAFLALASRHLDALAVQYYGVFRDQAAELARWHVTSGLPILLADSCFAVRTEALPQPCGVVVGSQEERAEAFERYAREALAQPWVIGWLWCGYVDGSVELEPRRQHMGLLDAWGQPYRPLVERMRRTYGELYVLARGGRDDARPPVLAEPPGSPPGTPAWPLPTAPFQRRLHPMARILKDAIQEDLEQMLEEGHPREALGVEMEATLATGSVDALLALQQSWWERPSPPSFPYQEPNDWETISAGFPDDASRAPFSGTEADLFDRLHGGWLGRCAGCQLGKPLEIWNASDPDTIEKTLRASGSYPLEFYMNPIPANAQLDWHPNPTALLSPERRALCRGGFSAVAPDDDIHYVLLSQMVLERYGIGFASSQALRLVADRSPYAWTWASGKNMIRMGNLGLGPPDTALFGNPCRQSLGAQIRCDPWGWAAPGHPSLAARLAYKDAVNSQTRNGIYSGIFFAVLLADVLAHGEIPRAVHTALAHVPPRSRLAEMLRFLINACGRESDWRPVCTAIHERPYHYAKRFNHAIPNAAIVVLGLLKGEGNFARTLGITVMAGLDTDCNGATAGSILGCALGAARIPTAWVEPFHDTVHTQLPGMAALSIESLARRMTALATPTAFTHTRIPG